MLYMFAASLLAAAMMLALMPRCILRLRKLKFGQTMYELGPKSHLNKQGTPNMGGIVLGPVAAACAVLGAVFVNARYPMAGGAFWSLDNALWALLFVSLGAMAIGFADDYVKDVKKRHEGLKPLQKVAGQLFVGLVFAVWGYFYVGSEVIVPFTGKTWDLGICYIPLIALTVLFMTNSANLQDGVDGLLSSVTVVGMAAFAVIALLMGMSDGAGPLANAQVTALLAFALAGACVGFLRFNRHPAQIFMGDTGSMFIGGVMVGAAVALRCEFLLLLICFTCVASSASVILQRYYFKLTHGKRIFKMSPIHHHFEMCGMTENAIVRMYAAATLVLSAVAVWSMAKWY